jgi:hypothetical protein
MSRHSRTGHACSTVFDGILVRGFVVFEMTFMFGTLRSMNDGLRCFRLSRGAISAAIVSMLAAAIVAASTRPALAWSLGSLLNNSKPAASDKFQIIHVAALAALIATPADHVKIYDANGWGLRSTAGIIPGAHLLTSDDKYNVAAELPADKSAKLVFYCADTH